MKKQENQITILIADDNAIMRESLRSVISVLETAKLIAEAYNGEEAIKLAKEYSPDIILMDINMSPINGFEATRKIIKDNPAAKIIGISDNKKISYVKNMLKLGAKGYVVKTSSYEVIIEAIIKVTAGEKYIDREIKGII
jgi:two-component system invasion response regulator UvrY